MRKHIAHFKPEKVLLFDPAVLKDQDIILGLKKKHNLKRRAVPTLASQPITYSLKMKLLLAS